MCGKHSKASGNLVLLIAFEILMPDDARYRR